MNRQQFFLLSTLLSTIFTLQSCRRNSTDVWEDTKSAGRHMNRGIRSLGGKNGDSRQVRYRSDFESIDDDNFYPEGECQDCHYQEDCNACYNAPQDICRRTPINDFIPIENEISSAQFVAPPPRETPGEEGSSIPGIQAFRDPSKISPQLARIFRPIYFEYDSSLVKGEQNLQTIHEIVHFLQSERNIYVFIEGHTDERGPQVYNFALGSRRANTVRNLLIAEGIHPDRLFTISYGKERPVILEQSENGWAKNRRDEFKIYAR